MPTPTCSFLPRNAELTSRSKFWTPPDRPLDAATIRSAGLACTGCVISNQGQRLYIAVTGKDHADSKGSVNVRVVDLHTSRDAACLEAQKLMAGADAAYAAGQAVTRRRCREISVHELRPGLPASGERLPKAAARLGTESDPALRAQAELARATLLNMDVDDFVEAREWAAKGSTVVRRPS